MKNQVIKSRREREREIPLCLLFYMILICFSKPIHSLPTEPVILQPPPPSLSRESFPPVVEGNSSLSHPFSFALKFTVINFTDSSLYLPFTSHEIFLILKSWSPTPQSRIFSRRRRSTAPPTAPTASASYMASVIRVG